MSDNLRTNLHTKLLNVMQAIDHVEKKGHNEKQNYDYVRATDLYHAIRKALVAQKILLTVSTVHEERWEVKTERGNTLHFCKVTEELYFRDTESDNAVGPLNGYGWGMDSGDKAPFKAQTGALKYALRKIFLVPDDIDVDDEPKSKRGGEAHVEEQRSPKPKDAGSTPATPAIDPNAPYKLTSDEKKKIRTYGVEVGKLKAFILRMGETDDIAKLTKLQWEGIFDRLDKAHANGNLKAMVEVSEVSANPVVI